MWYFNVLPLSTYSHPQYPTTNWGEQVVALYCTILFMWWYKDELWLDGLKINHLKTQTMHVCNTKIKQNAHQFIFTLLLQYTTYIAVIFYLLLSHYFSPTVLIYKVSVTKHQSAVSFGIFVFKLPYICNSIHQCHSSCLSIWRDRVTSLKKGMVSQIQQKHIPFKTKTAHMLCI